MDQTDAADVSHREQLRAGLRRLVPAVPAACAFLAAAAALGEARGTELAPDASGYLELAEQFGFHSLGAGVREPVWPMLLAGPVHVLGAHPTVIRLAGLVFFPILVVAAQLCLRRVVSATAGWWAALFLAASPWLAQQSVTGLREVPTAAGVLLFVYAAMSTQASGVARMLRLGAASGALALLRWDSILLTIPLLALLLVQRRTDWRGLAAAVTACVALVSPLLVGNAVVYDDPLHHSNVHAVFFRNLDLAGQPGYPTREELVTDTYLGPPTTWKRYLLHESGPEQTVRRAATGGPFIALNAASRGMFSDVRLPLKRPDLGILRSGTLFFPWLVLALAITGALRLLHRGQIVLPVAAVIATWQLSPVARFLDPRLWLTVFPLLVMLAAVGATAVAERLRRQPREPVRP